MFSFTAIPFGEATVNGAAATLDFRSILTDGSALVRREGSDWVLRPFPDDRPLTVELDASHFGTPATAQVVNGWSRLVDGSAGLSLACREVRHV